MDGSSNALDEMIHRHVSWMVAADVSILDFLYAARDARNEPAIQTPNTIHLNTGYSRQHASLRCQELSTRGLVERVGDGRYRLTDLGEQTVENEISIAELNDLEADTEDADANGGG